MPWTHDATNPTPWAAATATAALTAPVIDTRHRLRLGLSPIPAWDIDLDIDIVRSPTAIAHAKVPAGTTVALGDSFTILAGAGTDLQVAFDGIVTAIDRHTIGPDQWIDLDAASRDALLDLPTPTAYTAPTWATYLPDIFSGALGSTPFTAWGATIHLGDQTTVLPNSTQSAAMRATDIGIGDNIDTWLHSLADTLGHRLTGDYLGAQHYLLRDRNPASAPALSIDTVISDLHRRTSVDDLCNVVDLTATWYESNGQQQRSRRLYATPGTPTIRAARAYDITYRPPLSGGVRQLTATNPTALNYLTRSTITEIATITTRALWWLQPLHRITADGTTWTIQTIRHHIDTGTMTITASTPAP